MDLQTQYNNLIKIVRNNPLKDDTATNKHHILPKCIGGDNSSSNLIVLTLTEHAEAHRLLSLIHPEHNGLAVAANALAGYLDLSPLEIEKMRDKTRGRKQTKEHINKRVKSRKGYAHSDETIKKITSNRKYKPLSFEQKIKISNSSKGHKKSHETREAMSKAQKGRKISQEHRYKLAESKRKRTKEYNIKVNDNIYYGSIKEISSTLNIGYRTFLGRLKNTNFPNYEIIT